MAKILVVDDSGPYRDFVKVLLGRHGYEVLTVGDVAAALATLEIEPPDLILTDLDLPWMKGTELVRALSERGSKIPVIVITGMDDAQERRKAVELGCAEFLVKPVTNTTLLESIERHLPEVGAPS